MITTSQTPSPRPSSSSVPLCIDLDGTLVKSDTLHESLLLLAKSRPIDLLRLPFWLPGGKAHFKQQVAERVNIDPKLLPYNDTLLKMLRDEKAVGRDLILATAANERIANSISDYLGLFSEIVASGAHVNMSGENKRDALMRRFGTGNFDYAGNGQIDLLIWAEARAAWLVNPDRGVEEKLNRIAELEQKVDTRKGWACMVPKVLHVHRSPQHLLVLLPLLAAYYWEYVSLMQVGLGFLAFSLCASGASLVHEMLNLPMHRTHPSKRLRPLASGDFSLAGAVLVAAAALIGGFTIAALLPTVFWVTLACYFIVSLGYSLYA